MKREITLCFAAVMLLCPILRCPPVHAADAEQAPARAKIADADVVEFFSAADAGQIDVRFIPRNAAEANVLIANKTDRVIHLRLPKAFAAVPVLGQFDAGLGQGGGGGGGASQGVGGGFNGGGGQAGGQGLGGQGLGGQGFGGQGFGGGQRQGGFMRIPPQKTRKMKATTVCLEHGKPEPNPRIQYRILPINQFSDDARVAQLCEQLAAGKVSQNTAQAAAWHLANRLTWQRLASINRVESRYRGNIKFFKANELKQAQQFVASIESSRTDESDYEN